ncbi:IclR family transcriptional regulator [Sphingomonas sp. AP4-R1]|uniref:IclR family transcriptional regulator n=1 Tax=Sphingomonas sp. AP4-R1 TaxID=2735134 RepID=UPI0020A25D84|nr:IclR family transcriptional regulator C-terminal domain-containing protein [Sphingomonas sp. AP4-R1]
MVKQEQRSGSYDLDSGAIRIGLAALARIDVFRMADEVFRDFAQSTGRTLLVAIWGDAGPTIVRWFDGSPPVITSLAIGSVLPLLRSATGRVFYAFGDRAHVDRLEHGAMEDELHFVRDAESIREQVAAELVAVVRGDLIPGLRAAAAPVFDLQGRLVLVASALSNEARGSSGDDQETITQLQGACKYLTECLGGTWPTRQPPRRSKSKAQPSKTRTPTEA